MKLHIVGASNGKEIFRSFLKYRKQVPNAVPKITFIKSHCVPGTKYPELIWPTASELGKDDVLLILPFGNELQKGKYIRDSTPSRTFHLINFVPESDTVFADYMLDLQCRLMRYQCKILVINAFFRFLCGCHVHPKLIPYIHRRNTELAKILKPLSNVTVLDHRTLVSEKIWKIKRNPKLYMNLLRDSVHFKDNDVIARRIYGHM